VPEPPLAFTAVDPEVALAVEHHADLYGRWLDADAAASDAAREVERAGQEDAEARAQRIAGGEQDPGARSLDRLQKHAEKAAKDRDVIAQACDLARGTALRVARERSGPWTEVAVEQLEESGREMLVAIAALDDAVDDWLACKEQLALAVSERARLRGGGSRPIPPVPGLPAINRNPYNVDQVLDGLRALAATTDASVEAARVA